MILRSSSGVSLGERELNHIASPGLSADAQFVTFLALTFFRMLSAFSFGGAGFWRTRQGQYFSAHKSGVHLVAWRPLSRSHRVSQPPDFPARGFGSHDFLSAPSTSILRIAARGAVRRVVKADRGRRWGTRRRRFVVLPRIGAAMPDVVVATEVQHRIGRQRSDSCAAF